MSIMKWAAVGLAGVVAYKAWQRRQSEQNLSPALDKGEISPPLADALAATAGVEPMSTTTTQSSTEFGER